MNSGPRASSSIEGVTCVLFATIREKLSGNAAVVAEPAREEVPA